MENGKRNWVEKLFYETFNEEDWELKHITKGERTEQYAVIDRVYGVALTFDITYDLNIYTVNSVNPVFFATKYKIKDWSAFIEKCDDFHQRSIALKIVEDDYD